MGYMKKEQYYPILNYIKYVVIAYTEHVNITWSPQQPLVTQQIFSICLCRN